MRGEHSMDAIWSSTHCGSSPHARGARLPRGERLAVPGIIPACAGSTASRVNAASLARDHPRMRGEHDDRTAQAVERFGSSPHARGAPRAAPPSAALAGIIPACAGSTSTGGRRPCRCRDHPRMRGEHNSTRTESPTSTGSSPHARGAHDLGVHVVAQGGIIPACAGSTSTRVL